MYICICVYMNICFFVQTYICINVYGYRDGKNVIHVHLIYVYMFIYICIHIDICKPVYLYICMYIILMYINWFKS